MSPLRAAILRGARASRRSGGALTGTRPGDGLVFDRLRAYVPGDDPRRIDHAATARAGSPQTRVYREETALVAAAIVDESASMRLGRRRTVAEAADEAVRAWFGALEGEDRAVRVLDGRIVRGRAAAAASARAPFAFAEALALAVAVIPRGASLLAIGDGLDLADDAALARAARRFDATFLLARDPWADGLGLRGFVRLRDAENGSARRLYVGAGEDRRYVAASAAREASLVARLRDAGWRVGPFDEGDGRAALHRAFGLRA